MVKIIGVQKKFKRFDDAKRFADKHNNAWEHMNHYTEIRSQDDKHILRLVYDPENDEMIWKWFEKEE